MGLSRGNKEKAEMCNYIIISRKQKKKHQQKETLISSNLHFFPNIHS